MQMQQIRYFLALCEERNFTRAAGRCAGPAQYLMLPTRIPEEPFVS